MTLEFFRGTAEQLILIKGLKNIDEKIILELLNTKFKCTYRNAGAFDSDYYYTLNKITDLININFYNNTNKYNIFETSLYEKIIKFRLPYISIKSIVPYFGYIFHFGYMKIKYKITYVNSDIVNYLSIFICPPIKDIRTEKIIAIDQNYDKETLFNNIYYYEYKVDNTNYKALNIIAYKKISLINP